MAGPELGEDTRSRSEVNYDEGMNEISSYLQLEVGQSESEDTVTGINFPRLGCDKTRMWSKRLKFTFV